MAKPDLDDGYLRIAHELFAALALAGFTKWEWAVLNEVLDQLYGPRKGPTAFLYPSEIARHVSTYKQSIGRAITDLVAAGVLVKTGEGEYAFVKDYERWTRRGKPRLTSFERMHCLRRKRYMISKASVNNGADTHKPTASTTALTAVSASDDAASAHLMTGVNNGADAKSVPPRTPSKERAGKNELKTEREEELPSFRVPSDDAGSRTRAGACEIPLDAFKNPALREQVARARRAKVP